MSLLTKNESKKKLVPHKKYLVSLIIALSSNRQLGRHNLMQLFCFWFEKDVISLYNNFKHQWENI